MPHPLKLPATGSQRVLDILNQVLEIIQQENPVDETIEEVIEIVGKGFTYPDICVRIRYKQIEFSTSGFMETLNGLTERFSTIDGEKGVIDAFYIEEHPPKDEGVFSRDERSLLNQLARMLTGFINRIVAERSHSESVERLKELSTINRTTRIINEGKSIDDVLQQVAFIMPLGWQYPEFTVARISYGGREYKSEHFMESEWVQTQRLHTSDGQSGSIDVFYVKEFPSLNGDPFLAEERDLLINLSRLITDFLNSQLAAKDKFERQERVKELQTINETARIIALQMPIAYTLSHIVDRMPAGMQHPDYSVARITLEGQEYLSPGFVETPWLLRHSFETINGKKGTVEIYYLKELAKTQEELFLNEENDLILNLSHLIVGYLNSMEARNLMEKVGHPHQIRTVSRESDVVTESTGNSKHLLQNFMHRNNAARDIYHDLMPFKVKEILLVATLYDAYAIENEGRFTEQVMGGFYQLHLSLLPRVTGVTTYEEAMAKLSEKHYDLIIVMVGVEKQSPMALSQMVKKEYPYIPIFMLLNNDGDIPYFQARQRELGVLDEIFVWNGDPKVFSSMVYHLEDKVNVENDTEIGLARVILLVEDSVRYYSKYLPLLYASVLEQTKRLIDDVKEDELYAVLRHKARPKILLARTYEEAQEIFEKYRDYLLCLISDVEFSKNGQLNANAGFELVNYVKSHIKDLPVILQSSKIEYSQDAYELKTVFINKYSESLIQDIKTFISHYLGFGNFAYKDANGRTIAVARNLKEFERTMRKVPAESIVYHARKNHFSLWLMARGEIKIARKIAPYRITDFEGAEEIRSYLLEVIKRHREEKNQGKVIDFDEVETIDDTNIVSLSGGSLGGKGRGLSFINTLLFNFDFETHVPGINIRTPRTTVVGADEFELFMERNSFRELIFRNLNYHQIKKLFLGGELSLSLVQRLKRLLTIFTGPIAVRSSGLLEDSQKQPFSGVFETYLLPNNADTQQERLKELCNAIKLVFASVFSDSARAFTEAVDFKIEEEKMAVVIQEAVGHTHDNVFYPHISGVAQSYNYYSFGHMNPEDGFAVMALGFGKYVVDGEKALRFCPVYPDLDNNSPKDQLKNSQTEFYAIDLRKKNLNLLEGETAGLVRLDVDEAEMHGTLSHLASVYNPDNNTIQAGLDASGPRVLNFADILKYKYIPLSRALEVVLDVVKESMGAPVEIEFAVDLKKDKDGRATFYLLQIKPLLGGAQNYSINMERINTDEIILQSEQSMGNGKNKTITDIIYIDSARFDKAKTRDMASEIERLNAKMKQENRHYILMGPGRWGTRDPWIGIPVNWTQISNAKMIVETDLDDFPLEASCGSHFFHNVTTMQVGYCSVVKSELASFIKWDVLKGAREIEQTTYFRHIRFDKPLVMRMDGKKRKAIITL
ncbi:pyruvate, phosphate dikinase [Carboxylicivirga mesophila]|uniref:Pyruvate, phosphate dikinase n=1 Tax=Carboxylicivirga mesophila TaxID=1166478 RepID=A0ABS5K682_9BACT|nr:PEP/pyruvate-binding domain-containing protein [Carboxylicivirga mesophila]MBS2210457.1 pyruvate, phosphate dikinase [Carboxylicivirga mesophila]